MLVLVGVLSWLCSCCVSFVPCRGCPRVVFCVGCCGQCLVLPLGVSLCVLCCRSAMLGVVMLRVICPLAAAILVLVQLSKRTHTFIS